MKSNPDKRDICHIAKTFTKSKPAWTDEALIAMRSSLSALSAWVKTLSQKETISKADACAILVQRARLMDMAEEVYRRGAYSAKDVITRDQLLRFTKKLVAGLKYQLVCLEIDGTFAPGEYSWQEYLADYTGIQVINERDIDQLNEAQLHQIRDTYV